MNKPIEDITESAAGLISFTFNGGGKTVGIQDIHTEGQAFTDTTPINVYTPSGRRLMSTTYGNFRSSRTPAGVYLIKSATDTRKVIK